MQITEFENHLAFIRQFINGFGKLSSKLTILYPFHYIITIRLIEFNPLLINFRYDSFVTILDVPVLQNIQSTGIHRPIQKCPVSALPPSLYPFRRHNSTNTSCTTSSASSSTHNTCGIEKQIGIVFTEKEFIS